jgi:hypothetical protein
LLFALKKGWEIAKVELAPSWDQYGFIYIVSLMDRSQKQSLILILPRNGAVENLIRSSMIAKKHSQENYPKRQDSSIRSRSLTNF